MSQIAQPSGRVSIVTPTLNSARFIEACVAGVVGQGDAVLEHIIVDGGSTDGTIEIVERLMADHAHLRLLRGPDEGQSDAMNKGSAAARGEIIGLLNCDDFHEAGVVAKAAEHLAQMGGLGFVSGDCRVIDQFGELAFWNYPTDLRLEALLLGWKRAQHPCNPSAYFYHKAVHELVGGYDLADHLTMDFDFILSCAAKVKMSYVAEHWGNFRLIPGCKSFENRHSGPQRTAAMLSRHRGRLNATQRKTMNRLRAAGLLGDAKRKLKRVARIAGMSRD